MKQKRQRQLGLSRDDDRSDPKEELTKWEQQMITRKKWIYSNNKLFTENKKEVVPKQELFQVLSHPHSQISHRGREITEKWIRENYAEISQKVVNTFVKMCPYHAEKNPLMSRVKSVQRPMQAPTFLSLIEIDLMDFCKCSCDCEVSHMWVMNITDHHTKHVAMYPLTAKSGENVLDVLHQHCYTYGFPQKIVCDN